jgi:hypothetical protein
MTISGSMEINFGDPTMAIDDLHDIVSEAREQDVGKPCKRGFVSHVTLLRCVLVLTNGPTLNRFILTVNEFCTCHELACPRAAAALVYCFQVFVSNHS